MVGTLVRLQLKLYFRGIRGSAGRIVAVVIAGAAIAGAVLAASIGLAMLRGAPVDVRGGVGVLAFSCIALVWPMLALIASGADQTLDPGRFALFPLRARDLQPGLLAVGLIGVGGLTSCALALGYAYAWTTSPVPTLIAIVGGALGVVTIVVTSRALTALFAKGLATRRYQDFAASILALLVIAASIALQFIYMWVGTDPTSMGRRAAHVGAVLAWTPIGWVWALPWDAAEGRWGSLVARALLASGLLALGWRLWQRSLDAALVSPLESGGGGGKVKASSLVERLLPGGPVGAIGWRSLKYWRRDPRHIVAFIAALILPLLMILPMIINPLPGESLQESWVLVYPVIGSILMGSTAVAGEINYDGSALWTHVVAPIRGRDDRLGRLIALLLIFIPATIATDLLFLALSRQWQFTVALLGAGLGSLAASAAAGTLVGAWWQYAVPPPGSNPFGKGAGGGAVAFFSSIVCMIGSVAASIPFIVPAVLTGTWPWLGWLALVLALVLGPAMIWASALVGGRRLDETWPDVLRRVTYESN